MTLFEIKPDSLVPINSTKFSARALLERRDLQRLLRDHIDVLAGAMGGNLFVLAEEFGHWEEGRRRIDLLCLDKQANLVVVELKRTDDGGHMDLQAVRYAAMVAKMTFEQAVDAHREYLKRRGLADRDPQAAILEFIEVVGAEEVKLGEDVRIVLAAADFSREITTTVLWLREYDLDIRCVQMMPYALDERTLIEVRQVVPLPEASDYIVGVQARRREARAVEASARDRTKFDVSIDGVRHEGLTKRATMLLLARTLVQRGHGPGAIEEALGPLGRRRWTWVEGGVGETDFRLKAAQKARAEGKYFDPVRWHAADDELIHHDGRTYAFSNQWGEGTHEAVERLRRHLGFQGIEVSRTAEG